MVFRGVHAINMDAKGRLAMPTRYRAALTAENARQKDEADKSQDAQGSCEIIATIDIQSRCLLIYPLTIWLEIEQKLQQLPALNASSRRLQRLMLGYASELSLDSNGRMLMPASLREYAQLEKKVMLVGQGSKFELWSEALWAKETEQAMGDALSGELDIPPDIQDMVL